MSCGGGWRRPDWVTRGGPLCPSASDALRPCARMKFHQWVVRCARVPAKQSHLEWSAATARPAMPWPHRAKMPQRPPGLRCPQLRMDDSCYVITLTVLHQMHEHPFFLRWQQRIDVVSVHSHKLLRYEHGIYCFVVGVIVSA